jgi:hypothetical protein
MLRIVALAVAVLEATHAKSFHAFGRGEGVTGATLAEEEEDVREIPLEKMYFTHQLYLKDGASKAEPLIWPTSANVPNVITLADAALKVRQTMQLNGKQMQHEMLGEADCEKLIAQLPGTSSSATRKQCE